MITIAEVQAQAWKNKLAKGFNTSDVPREFALTFTELGEAFDAWRRDPACLPGELADALIFLAGIAEMTGVDLDAAVVAKLAVNEGRVYERNDGGHLIKTGSERNKTRD